MPEEGLEPSRDCSHRILSPGPYRDYGVRQGTQGQNSGLSRFHVATSLPYGAPPSGTLRVQSGGGFGLGSVCIGGGQGIAVIVKVK